MKTLSALTVVSDCRLQYFTKPGAFNTQSFIEALCTFDIAPGTVVLLDNVAFHHSTKVINYARGRGWELLFVPPYSPWFNPVEGVFSVIKRHFYRQGDVVESFRSVTSAHLSAFFRHSMCMTSGPTLISPDVQ